MSYFTSPLKVYFHYFVLYLGLVVFSTLIVFSSKSFANTISYTCVLPYNIYIKPDTAQIIAKSFAYSQAFLQVEEDIKNNTAINLSFQDINLHKAVAAELYLTDIILEPSKFSPATGDVHVTVKTTLPSDNINSKIKELLSNYHLLEMRSELLTLLSVNSKAGQRLILLNSSIHNNQQKTPPQTLYKELSIISQRLQALWMFNDLLKYFNQTWQEPSLVQKSLLKATALAPSLALLWVALGEAQLQMDQPQTALININKALSLQNDNARAFYLRGLAHLRLQQPTLAKADLDTALKYKPENADFLNARGAILLVLEDHDNMCADFEKACGFGNCEGIAHARKRKLCLQ